MDQTSKNQLRRQFSPYERNQLRQFGVDETKAQMLGQMPVEYITGHVRFSNLDFLIDQRALIPRVETEELVELALKLFTPPNILINNATNLNNPKSLAQTYSLQLATSNQPTILDLGTGSGAIALSLAYQLEKSNLDYRIVATDIDQKALELAKENRDQMIKKFQINSLKSKVNFIHSDLCENLPRTKFDLIIANLPYIPTSRIKVLDSSVKDFEPHLALDGGEDGLDLISQFLNQARQYLNHQGLILMEIDYTHPELLRQRFAKHYQIKTWTSQLSKATFAQLKPK